jgi:hypothetical protein
MPAMGKAAVGENTRFNQFRPDLREWWRHSDCTKLKRVGEEWEVCPAEEGARK